MEGCNGLTMRKRNSLTPLSFCFIRQQYEVEWRCSSGSGRAYCYWFYSWKSIVVNTTSAKLNMTSFGVTYMFKITPTIPSRGKGKPFSLAVTMPDFTASIGNFTCWAEGASNGTRLECHWSRPTGFDPSRFYVSDNKLNLSAFRFNFLGYLKLSNESNTILHRFYFNSLCDWSKNFASPSTN